jgi:hypothetical protein
LTKFDGVLVTIRSKKSFFEVTKAIESSLQRFWVPRLMEYVAHADREGLEAYVDEVSGRCCVKPSRNLDAADFPPRG